MFRKPKAEPQDIAKFIGEHAAEINGSLCVFGDWFGRPMDNWHQLVSHDAKEAYVRLAFDEGETLEVWDPSEARMDGKSFVIKRASRVRWEWFYYGRPKLPENRFFIERIVTAQGSTRSRMRIGPLAVFGRRDQSPQSPSREKKANKAPEPTTGSVTICADAQLAPAPVVAHL